MGAPQTQHASSTIRFSPTSSCSRPCVVTVCSELCFSSLCRDTVLRISRKAGAASKKTVATETNCLRVTKGMKLSGICAVVLVLLVLLYAGMYLDGSFISGNEGFVAHPDVGLEWRSVGILGNPHEFDRNEHSVTDAAQCRAECGGKTKCVATEYCRDYLDSGNNVCLFYDSYDSAVNSKDAPSDLWSGIWARA